MTQLPPASLYRGKVMHARMKPKVHRFTYRVYALLIDLDRLAQASRQSGLFSVNRFNLLSFYERDFGAGAATGLRAHVNSALAQAGMPGGCARVALLCYPRLLGFAFNPLTVYYCFDDGDALCALIYEVRNTFGQKHSYVAPVRPGEVDAPGVRQERDKLFYVSPFLDMPLHYRFRLSKPGAALSLRILENDATGPVLAATFSGTQERLTTSSLLRAFFAVPLLTFKIVAAINFEALRLWLKGVTIKARPTPPVAMSFGQELTPEIAVDPPPLRDNFTSHGLRAAAGTAALGEVISHS